MKLKSAYQLDEILIELLKEKDFSEGIYISGQVTGLEPLLVNRNFLTSELYAQFELGDTDYDYISKFYFLPPQHIDQSCDWKLAMRLCINVLSFCSTIVMQPNWEQSEGATVEHDLAHKLGLKIIYMKDWLWKDA